MTDNPSLSDEQIASWLYDFWLRHRDGDVTEPREAFVARLAVDAEEVRRARRLHEHLTSTRPGGKPLSNSRDNSPSGSEATTTVMPADQFDELIASLDTPDDAPALRSLATRPRRYEQT